jgi:hypothetical protein
MNTLIDNRERASRKRERFCQRLSHAIVSSAKHEQQCEASTCVPLRESITKLETTIAYLNSEISSCQQVLMAYDDEQQQANDSMQGPDPQLIVDCVNDSDELRYLLSKLIEQTIEKVCFDGLTLLTVKERRRLRSRVSKLTKLMN